MSEGRATRGSVTDRPFRLAEFLPYRIVSLGQAMGQGLARQYAEEFGLSIPEWRTLALIGQYEAVTAAEVVAETPMDKATVSRASASLTRRGLVERVPHEADRRATTLRLSAEGRTVFAAVSEKALAYEDALLEGFTAEERALFDRLLDKLREGAA